MRNVREYSSGWLEVIDAEQIDSWRIYLHPDSPDKLDELWQETTRYLAEREMNHTALIKRRGPPFYLLAWRKRDD
jgi:hypothetical protein